MTKTKSEFCPALTNYGTKIKVISFADERKTILNCYVENKEADYYTTIKLEDIQPNKEVNEFLGIKGDIAAE